MFGLGMLLEVLCNFLDKRYVFLFFSYYFSKYSWVLKKILLKKNEIWVGSVMLNVW